VVWNVESRTVSRRHPSVAGSNSFYSLTFTGSDEKKADLVLPILYTEAWLDAKSEIVEGQTNREVTKKVSHRIETFMQKLTRRYRTS
jgi:hypothetical protein